MFHVGAQRGGGLLTSVVPHGVTIVRVPSSLRVSDQPGWCHKWWWRAQARTTLERQVGPPLEKCTT